ncbi:hypothetical protein P4388_20150 [Bacillus thuringiensis]|uniref:hypothetical protein n=1 Tax=Bacillus thuringiensis TaxID=1428 RepID=UPI001592BF02|nr:hypothetical protein [Bacillus thuringiensis]MED3350921.1 hypothetical protein [Bacillus thuringiensis]
MFKKINKGLKETLFMVILFSLFFMALLFDEKTGVSSALMCFFSIFASDKFSQRA